MLSLARLLVPAIRWDVARGFDPQRDAIDHALALGVGGFLIRGGTREAVAALAAELHERSRTPLLLAAGVERGAGQQFEGCVGLPPLGALGALGDLNAVHRAAQITARELKELRLNWALAPVCDLDVEPESPMVGTRGAGADPARVSAVIEEWIDACQAEGVLACAKHFPGHGHAVHDVAHDAACAPPVVRARAGALRHEDLAPFRVALDAGVASMMVSCAAFPSLDSSGASATFSAPILTELLRREMKFDGLAVSDALERASAFGLGPEPDAAVRAIAAGCDVLLGPTDVAGVARALERAALQGEIEADRARDALERVERWAGWSRSTPGRGTTLDDAMWARQLADRTVTLARGAIPRLGDAAEIVVVDDEAGRAAGSPGAAPGSAAGARRLGEWTNPRHTPFAEALRALDVEAHVVHDPTSGTRVPVLVAVFGDRVEGKNLAGLSEASLMGVARILEQAHTRARETLVVLFAHPRRASQLSEALNVLCAWGGDAPMQAAAARVIVGDITSG